MAFEPYELLIRWLDGQITGAHIVVLENGKPLPAQVIELEDIPEFFPAPQALAEVSRLLDMKNALERQVRILTDECQIRESHIKTLRDKLAIAQRKAGQASG